MARGRCCGSLSASSTMITRFQKMTMLGLGATLAFSAALTPPLLALTNEHYRGYRLADWLGWAESLGDHAETRFAPGFAENQFCKVKPGMTPAEVRRLLGEPLLVFGHSVWHYSRPTDGNWTCHVREIDFNDQGRVETVDRSYYCE